LLRYGPDHGVYLAPSVAPRTYVDPANPSATPEPIPTAGQVLSASYHSPAMGEDRHFMIYLPPTYGLKAATRKRYAVLYLLHGDPGGPDQWIRYGAAGIFDSGIARGALPETILVLPDGNGHVTAAAQWANRYDGRDRVEDALIELVDVVDNRYRTIPDRQHRLIAGLSSGAFGAANIAARHASVFSIAMSFSGYYIASGPVFGYNPVTIRNNSPYYIVQDEASARTVHYILVVGDRDPYYKRSTQAFADRLARLNVPHDLIYLPGGHSASIWVNGLVLGMDRMAQSLSPTFRFGTTRRQQL
jgi:enterochelin esterase family protein